MPDHYKAFIATFSCDEWEKIPQLLENAGIPFAVDPEHEKYVIHQFDLPATRALLEGAYPLELDDNWDFVPFRKWTMYDA